MFTKVSVFIIFYFMFMYLISELIKELCMDRSYTHKRIFPCLWNLCAKL